MNRILGFVRTTLVGGVLYLVPIVILLAVLGKAFSIAQRLAPGFEDVIEALQLGHVLTPQVFAILMIVLFCFAAGLFSRTVVARRIGDFLESRVLVNIPGYAMIKSMSEDVAGVHTSEHQLVLARIEDAWQIALVADRFEDGHLAIYVPGVPEPRAGSLYFMTPDRVKPLSISMTSGLQVLRRMGFGSSALLKSEFGSK